MTNVILTDQDLKSTEIVLQIKNLKLLLPGKSAKHVSLVTISLHYISTITHTSTGSESICSKIILVLSERDKITARELQLTTYNLKLSRGEKRWVEAKLCGLVWMLRSWQPAIIQFQGNVSNASKTESCRLPPVYQNPKMFPHLLSQSNTLRPLNTALVRGHLMDVQFVFQSLCFWMFGGLNLD